MMEGTALQRANSVSDLAPTTRLIFTNGNRGSRVRWAIVFQDEDGELRSTHPSVAPVRKSFSSS